MDGDIRGYLSQLDDTLKTVLESLSGNVLGVKSVLTQNGSAEEETNKNIYSIAVKLKQEQLQKFDELKSDIIRTADEVTQGCKAYTDERENSVIAAVESGYTAKGEFGEYTSAVNGTLGVYDGRISANTQAIELIDSDYQEYKRTSSSDISLMPSAIISEVSESFISKNELGGETFDSFIGSKVTQSASGITEEFRAVLEGISDTIGETGDNFSEYILETNAYIRRGELEEGVFGLEIGRGDSNVKTRFLNDKISFYQGEVEVAYISNNSLYITRAQVLDCLEIGNSVDGYFTFDVSQNGLEVRWNQ
ncbi:MAG: hypothetical protein BWY46_00740 [Firmicutes bacterium ADurb.Bin300]|nr:MAG: hypothetical protein BWY46_00740 [Firmicutes bacterium ADurb.Bin300]